MLLPTVNTPADYRPIYRDAAVWLPAMRAICRRHHLDPTALRMAPPGTHVVFFVGTACIIKLFVPPWVEDAYPERVALAALRGHATIAVPQLIGQGELEGWPYLVLTTVPGRSLETVWPALSPADRQHIMHQLGALMRQLHALDVTKVEGLASDWSGFLSQQFRLCLDNQAQAGASAAWLEQIHSFLANLPPLAGNGSPSALLHSDITCEHVYLQQQEDTWQISGLIDWGDAMIGDPLYDFVAPALITRDDPAVWRALLQGYGFQPARWSADRAAELLAYALLHRYVRLTDFLADWGPHPPADLRELQRRLFDPGW